MSERSHVASFERASQREAQPAAILPLQRRLALGNGPQPAQVPQGTTSPALAVQMFADAVTAGLHARAVQLDGTGGGLDLATVHRAAAHGLSGAGGSLPHGAAIQRAFGRHDVTGVRAHVGGAAAEGSAAMGARAYASGDQVAFASEPDLHLAAHEAAHVVQQRSGVQLSGGVGATGDVYEQHADAVADAVTRGEDAEGLLDVHAPIGASGHGVQRAVQRDDEAPTAAPSAGPMTFAERFNTEFAAQLHIFGTEALPAAERGADTREATDASGDELTDLRLRQLFTATQIAKLTDFIQSRRIPDRLFNGDDHGAADAQQRILLSGHILSVGVYVPGSFTQRMHARMCGHWASLVNHYAGAAAGSGLGIIEDFDHAGGLSLSVEDSADGPHAATRRSEHIEGESTLREGAHATRAFDCLPIEQFSTIRAGDWLWIYNDNGVGGGNHSVIFSRWASGVLPEHTEDEEAQQPPRTQYRRAITMSQTGPSVGGVEETRMLGERFEPITVGPDANRNITPVTQVMHMDPSARPATTTADLVGLLGSGHEAEANRAHVARFERDGGTFDWTALATHIRGLNEPLIAQLAEVPAGGTRHMTEAQERMFRETNAGYHASAAEGTVGTLVRLNERLHALVHNAASLDEGRSERSAVVEATHVEGEQRTRPRREALEARAHELEQQLSTLEAEQHEIDERESELDVMPELRVARRHRYEQRPALRAQLRARPAPSATERARIEGELAALDTAVTELEERQASQHGDARAAHRDVVHRRGQRMQATNRLEEVRRQLRAVVGSAGYHMVAEGVGHDTFQGRGEHRVTGLVANLSPAPDWRSFVHRAE